MTPRLVPVRLIHSELGTLRFWGSECQECGNGTPGAMRCDECGSDAHTVALWMEQR